VNGRAAAEVCSKLAQVKGTRKSERRTMDARFLIASGISFFPMCHDGVEVANFLRMEIWERLRVGRRVF
jgi:hypothetical protein